MKLNSLPWKCKGNIWTEEKHQRRYSSVGHSFPPVFSHEVSVQYSSPDWRTNVNVSQDYFYCSLVTESSNRNLQVWECICSFPRFIFVWPRKEPEIFTQLVSWNELKPTFLIVALPAAFPPVLQGSMPSSERDECSSPCGLLMVRWKVLDWEEHFNMIDLIQKSLWTVSWLFSRIDLDKSLELWLQLHWHSPLYFIRDQAL